MRVINDQDGPARPQRRSPERKPATAAPQPETSDLVAEIIDALEQRGAPSGAWLVDIARARHALREADDLLRRMQHAIIRNASSSPLPDEP
jgi:hypothetical protein